MDHMKQRDLILNGDIKKVVFKLAIPVMISNLIQTVYNLTDTYFVGQMGTTEIAAVQFVWPLVFMVISFGIGLGVAATALISQYIGSHDSDKAAEVTGQVISFAMLFSVLLGFIAYLFSPQIVRIMGATGNLYDLSLDYIRIMFLGAPTIFAMGIYTAIKTGYGDTTSPMILGGLSVGINIVLDPILMFTLGMGIEGAALATVIARGSIGFYALYTILKPNSGIGIQPHHLKPNYPLLQKIIKLGFPPAVGQATSAVGFAVMNIFIISLGEATLTAFAIGNRINSIILMPAMGIGSAITTIIGQNLGSNNPERAKATVRQSTLWTTLMLVIGGAIIMVFAESIIRFFSDDPVVIQQTTQYLLMITASIPLMGFFQIFVGTFQGSGNTMAAMGLMIGRLWGIRVPMLFFLQNYTDFKPTSVWTAMVVSNAIICIIGLIIYTKGDWAQAIIETDIEIDNKNLQNGHVMVK